jgi:hypothetical protein
MNFRTTLVLLVLLIVAAVAFFLVRTGEQPANPPEQDKTTLTEGPKLFDIPPLDVNRLTITAADGSKTTLAKDKGKWRLQEPIKVPADNMTVDTFLETLLAWRSKGQFDPSTNSQSGLDKPAYKVEVGTTGGKTVQFDVGRKSSIGDTLYIKLGGATKAEIVPSELNDKFGRPINEWRDKKVVSTLASDILQIGIDRGDTKLAMEKKGPEWVLTSPIQAPAETSEITALTSAITSLEASEFVKADAPAVKLAMLDQPKVTVSFSVVPPSTQPATAPATMPVNGTVILSIGGYDNALKEKAYARLSDSPQVFKIPASKLKEFEKTALDLRDRKVLDADPEKVSEVSITIDRPSTTQPTTKPAEQVQLRITRRKENLALGPILAAPLLPTLPAATQPSTGPTTNPSDASASTQPATQPATQPVAEKLSKWVIDSENGVAADEDQVTTLLSQLHPLKTTKYLDKLPTTQPSPSYLLNVKTIGAGGADTASYELRITSMGAEGKPIAQYKDLTFEVDRPLIESLEGDFKTRKPPAVTPPPNFQGGMPSGFQHGMAPPPGE